VSFVSEQPYGGLLPEVSEISSVPAEPVDEPRAQNDSPGLHIDAHTSTPSWLGERLDLDYAISVLHPLACRPSVVVG
jgi:hypothetical protein